MFFIAGISNKIDKLDHNQTIICSNCGKYGRYEVFMEYTCLSLFFIPVFKWGKKYYAKTSCCGSVYLINNDIGRKIANNENIDIAEQDLQLVQQGHVHSIKRCTNCGFETNEDFRYCPHCSAMLK